MFKSLTIAALAAAILVAGLSTASAGLEPNGGGNNGLSPQGTQITGAGSTSVIVLGVELAPTQQ
jgi:ABC-type phosphate transport system substrate-binding protein